MQMQLFRVIVNYQTKNQTSQTQTGWSDLNPFTLMLSYMRQSVKAESEWRDTHPVNYCFTVNDTKFDRIGFICDS